MSENLRENRYLTRNIPFNKKKCLQRGNGRSSVPSTKIFGIGLPPKFPIFARTDSLLADALLFITFEIILQREINRFNSLFQGEGPHNFWTGLIQDERIFASDVVTRCTGSRACVERRGGRHVTAGEGRSG